MRKTISVILAMMFLLSFPAVTRADVTHPSVEGINIDNSCVFLIVGDEYSFSVTPVPESAAIGEIHWKSTDPSVISIDQNGKATALAKGNAQILAYIEAGRRYTGYCNVYVRSSMDDDLFDTRNAVNVQTTEDVISVLKQAARNMQEIIVLRAPKTLKILNDDPSFMGLCDEITHQMYSSYVGGLYDFADYNMDSIGCASDYGCIEDKEDRNYNYYLIEIGFIDFQEERALADEKLKTILANCENGSDGEKAKYIYDWMKTNLPPERDSEYGYTRGINGIYGALFGDGTGFCCATYAMTIQRYLELAGIDSYILSGAYMANEEEPCHCYNVVKIDGKWYLIDYPFDQCLVGSDAYGKRSTESFMVNKYMKDYPFAKKSWEPDPNSDINDPNQFYFDNNRFVISDETTHTVSLMSWKNQEVAANVPRDIEAKGVVWSVESIGKRAFYGKKCTSVELPDTVKTIGKEAFLNCKKLKTIILPATDIKLEENALKGTPKKLKIFVTSKEEKQNVKTQLKYAGNEFAKIKILKTP